MSTTADPKPLHVLAFEVNNVMAVKAVRLELPKSGVFRIGGENGAGKSSLINSLIGVFSGKGSEALPIRNGESEGHVTAELENLTITARYRTKKDGTIARELTVSNKDGARYQRPQDLLDELISKFAFDPFEFTRLKSAEQDVIFRKALGVDTADIDADFAKAYAERTDINRELARLKAANERMLEYPDAPDQEVSVVDLTQQLEAANAANREVETAKEKIVSMDEVLTNRASAQSKLDATVARLKEELTVAEKEASEYTAKTEEMRKVRDAKASAADALILVDTSDIVNALSTADAINQQVRANIAKTNARAQWQEWETKRVDCELRIEKALAAKTKLTTAAINSANLAVAGLCLKPDHEVELADGTMQARPGGLYVGDVPFAQVNTAEQLKLSVALAVHENPRLRIFRVKNGEHLTPTNVQVLHDLAIGAECLILMETPLTREDVASGFRKVEVFMEEGEAVELPSARNTALPDPTGEVTRATIVETVVKRPSIAESVSEQPVQADVEDDVFSDMKGGN